MPIQAPSTPTKPPDVPDTVEPCSYCAAAAAHGCVTKTLGKPTSTHAPRKAAAAVYRRGFTAGYAAR